MEYYKLARVLKPQGLKGELKLQPFTDDLTRFYDLSHIYIKNSHSYSEFTVEGSRTYKQFAYVKLAGVESCDQAEELRGSFLYIDRASAKKEEGSYFIADLIGMEVKDDAGMIYGSVSEVYNTGASDVYSVSSEKPMSFPAAPGVICDIDEQKRVITVNAKRLSEVAVYD